MEEGRDRREEEKRKGERREKRGEGEEAEEQRKEEKGGSTGFEISFSGKTVLAYIVLPFKCKCKLLCVLCLGSYYSRPPTHLQKQQSNYESTALTVANLAVH